MKSYPSELTTEVVKEYHSICHLFELSFSTPQYWTDADKDIYYLNKVWLTKGIAFDAVAFSSAPKVDSIEFQVDNVDNGISNIAMTEEVRGKNCIIYRVAVDKNMAVLGAATLFVGFTDFIEIDGQRARFQIYNHFIKWKMQTPRRMHQGTCSWVFSGTECAYSGAETWCDHSWERCLTLSNTLNFGGFRWLASLVDKKIWWGKGMRAYEV